MSLIKSFAVYAKGVASFLSFKRCVSIFTITFHLVIFLPNQSRAALPLVPLAATAVGPEIVAAGVVTAGVLAYHAPAIWDSTQQAVSSAGDTARLVYGLVSVPLAAGGEKLYGKLCTLGMKFQDLKEWALNNRGDAPLIADAIDSSGGSDPQMGDVISVTNTTTCDTSTVQVSSGPSNIGPGSYDLAFVSSYMCGGCSSGLTFREGNVLWIMGSATVVGDQCQFSSRTSYNAYTVPDETPLTPLDVDPSVFAQNLPATEEVAQELDKAFQANPDKVTVSDSDDATIASSGSAPIQQPVTDTSPYYADAAAATAQQVATDVQALADADPTNAALQIAALEAQLAAQQASLENVQANQAVDSVEVDLAPVVTQLQSIDSKLAAQNQGMELHVGESTVSPNTYDPNFIQPPEDDLGLAVATYIQNGMPYSDVFKNSGATVVSSDPVIRYYYKEQEFTIDFSHYQGILQIMGAGVFLASLLLSYFIIIGKS